MKKLLFLVAAVLAVLVGTAPTTHPAGAATAVSGGGGGGGGGPADGFAGTSPAGTGPHAGEIALGSFVAPTRTSAARHGAATGLKTNPTCAVQCITGGVAYGRGPDARLVVTTDTPATIRIVVSGPSGYTRQLISPAGATSFSADVDDLSADTAYTGVVMATDAYGNTALREGTFRTLQRDVEVILTEAHITAAPYGDEGFAQEIWFEGDKVQESWSGPASDDVLPLGVNILHGTDTDRFLQVAVELEQAEPPSDLPCELHEDPHQPESGQVACGHVQTAWFPDAGELDLDDRPSGAPVNHYWIETQLELPGGDALPPGYGLPLNFTVPIDVEVTWTRA